DEAAACTRLATGELVFDVQVHHVDANGPWRNDEAVEASIAFPYMDCGETDRIACLGVDHFLREVFIRSDTAVACLTGLPADPAKDSLPLEARIATQAIVERLS